MCIRDSSMGGLEAGQRFGHNIGRIVDEFLHEALL
jgi:hypothetical protein